MGSPPIDTSAAVSANVKTVPRETDRLGRVVVPRPLFHVKPIAGVAGQGLGTTATSRGARGAVRQAAVPRETDRVRLRRPRRIHRLSLSPSRLPEGAATQLPRFARPSPSRNRQISGGQFPAGTVSKNPSRYPRPGLTDLGEPAKPNAESGLDGRIRACRRPKWEPEWARSLPAPTKRAASARPRPSSTSQRTWP